MTFLLIVAFHSSTHFPHQQFLTPTPMLCRTLPPCSLLPSNQMPPFPVPPPCTLPVLSPPPSRPSPPPRPPLKMITFLLLPLPTALLHWIVMVFCLFYGGRFFGSGLPFCPLLFPWPHRLSVSLLPAFRQMTTSTYQFGFSYLWKTKNLRFGL